MYATTCHFYVADNDTVEWQLKRVTCRHTSADKTSVINDKKL